MANPHPFTVTTTALTSSSSAPDANPCCPNCGYCISATSPSPAIVSSTTGAAAATSPIAAEVDSQRLPSAAETELAAAQQHITDLEAQIQELNERPRRPSTAGPTTRTSSRNCAARSTPRHPHGAFHESFASSLTTPAPIRASFLPSPRRISSLLAPRKSTPNLRVGPAGPDSVEDLTAALAREQNLRKDAEARLRRTSAEVEELSAALFEQANEMVATERRARAKLEERVGVLEAREDSKKRRLEILEEAVGRMQKVRNVLDQQREKERGNKPAMRARSEGQINPMVSAEDMREGAVAGTEKVFHVDSTTISEGKTGPHRETSISETTIVSKNMATTVVTEVELV
ncbi:unnamed protein product [Parascedosporium putredinis]|uniref:GDP/GTP exchange factor Sec2 N-terminal domain-containing protein n=1 Tax=Parascedosporium putredinis TaxID=1442378 RepID=A0A9P1GUS0_9PEZI|nr:unnamed protein product [Parascedosporium putredinis]CAI7987488.1 unnamed protein product [Parascedosporium putredinis]